MTKDKMPSVEIKGNSYVLVKDRVLYFNEHHTNGAIQTELIDTPAKFASDARRFIVKATVIPDVATPARAFTAYSQEVEGSTPINRTSALENAETSAVGRALAMMGIGVIESIASADEIVKATNHQDEPKGQIAKDVEEAFASAAATLLTCDICGASAEERSGISKQGKPYRGIFCAAEKTHVKWLTA